MDGEEKWESGIEGIWEAAAWRPFFPWWVAFCTSLAAGIPCIRAIAPVCSRKTHGIDYLLLIGIYITGTST
jgi:hypothetical protein